MPCRDYAAEQEAASESWDRMHARLDLVTTLLCQACSFLEERDAMPRPRHALAQWWSAHAREDQAEKDREVWLERQIEERNKELAKLTPAERQLLGIK